MMKCIFCNQTKPLSDEHIIPENIGGRIVIQSVCECCNNKLGSNADSECNKHSFIFEAYRNIPEINNTLNFRPIKTFYLDENNKQISLKKSKNGTKKVAPTKIAQNKIVYNEENFQTNAKNIIKKHAKKLNIGSVELENAIKKLNEWYASGEYGKYKDLLTGVEIERKRGKYQELYKMNNFIPEKFVCKVLIEIASLLGISEYIVNKDKYIDYCCNNIRPSDIEFTESRHPIKNASPYHIIIIHNGAFIIQFFGVYQCNLNVSWIRTPRNVYVSCPTKKNAFYRTTYKDGILNVRNEEIGVSEIEEKYLSKLL